MSTKRVSGTFAASGNSAAIEVARGAVVMIGSSSGADFGSGTVSIQSLAPDGLYYPAAATFTAADVVNVTYNQPTVMRLTLASATNPDLDYAIISDVVELIE